MICDFVSFSDNLLQDNHIIFLKKCSWFWDSPQNMLNFDLWCIPPQYYVYTFNTHCNGLFQKLDAYPLKWDMGFLIIFFTEEFLKIKSSLLAAVVKKIWEFPKFLHYFVDI